MHEKMARIFQPLNRCLIAITSLQRSSEIVPPVSVLLQKRFFSQMMNHVPHVARTQKNFRFSVVSDASVTEVMNLSAAVKGLRLKVTHPEFNFRPGQWVDFFIPNLEEVGGFSICSTPQLLKENSEIILAVKKSKWAPANWVHTDCRAGADVQVRVGGDFFFDPDLQEKLNDILLIAGGVGINPLISIVKHLSEIHDQNPQNFPDNIRLIYSCKTAQDVLFKDEISEISRKIKQFKVQYYITRHSLDEDTINGKENDNLASVIKGSRITTADIDAILRKSKNNITDCFLCGPPPMIDNIVEILQSLNVPQKHIHYEKWW